jgi:hypothetical protein
VPQNRRCPAGACLRAPCLQRAVQEAKELGGEGLEGRVFVTLFFALGMCKCTSKRQMGRQQAKEGPASLFLVSGYISAIP